MAGLWLNMDTVVEGMVRLNVPRARNLRSILETYQVDSEWLNAIINELGLVPPSAQKGFFVAAPPPELLAFLRFAGVEEAVLTACPWPTLHTMRSSYLRVLLAHAPSYTEASRVLRCGNATRIKQRAEELGLPGLAFQRKGTMRPAPKEWVALHPFLCAPLNYSEPITFRTFTDNRARTQAELETTTRWIFPASAERETKPEPQRR